MNSIQREKFQSATTSTPNSSYDQTGSLQGRSAELADEELQPTKVAQMFSQSIIEAGLKKTIALDDPLSRSAAKQAVEKSLNEMEESIKLKIKQSKEDLEKSIKIFEETFKLLRKEVSPLTTQVEEQHKIGKQLQRDLALIENTLDRPKEIASKAQSIDLITSKDLASRYVKPSKIEVKNYWFEEETLFVTVTYERAKNSHPQFIAHGNYEELDFPTMHLSLLTDEQSVLEADKMEMVEETFSIVVPNAHPFKLITAEEAKNKELQNVKHLLAMVTVS